MAFEKLFGDIDIQCRFSDLDTPQPALQNFAMQVRIAIFFRGYNDKHT
jgi:hypothetical protein